MPSSEILATTEPFCACGCGQSVSGGRYRRGHNPKPGSGSPVGYRAMRDDILRWHGQGYSCPDIAQLASVRFGRPVSRETVRRLVYEPVIQKLRDLVARQQPLDGHASALKRRPNRFAGHAGPPLETGDNPNQERSMLVLKRKEGQWVNVTHRSGDVLRIRMYDIEPGYPGRCNMAFDDDARNFAIERPERNQSRVLTGHPAEVNPSIN